MASSSSSSPEISAPHSRTHSDPQPSLQTKLQEVLEDLSSRFILNLPDAELASIERVCFQVEQAHWYYEDFIREQDPSFPTMTLKKFSNSLFSICPLLSHWGDDHEENFQRFLAYKTRVPVCGAIMLNESWDKCLLVKGWKATSAWSFPKGKINQQEPRYRCAIREVLEETGYDLDGQIDHEDVLELCIKEQSISLYIVPNIPEDFPFETRTRKEISKIQWFRLSDLPTWKRNKSVPGKFYLITPFIGLLRTFIRDRKPHDIPRSVHGSRPAFIESKCPHYSDEDVTGAVESHLTSNYINTQESSSQSSSADNGEPQTPSPQYSEPLVHHAVDEKIATSHPESETHALNLGAVDPHFARLLTSLSLSASGVSLDGKVGTTVTNAAPDKIQDPAVVMFSSQDVKADTNPPSRAGSGRTSRPSQTPSAAPCSVQPSPAPLPSAQLNTPSTQLPSSLTSASLSTVSSQSIVSPSSANLVSPRLVTSKRGPDVSPYLTRATPVPGISKQMKYLNMLEGVAKESERMTPKLERQMLAGPPLPFANGPAFLPGPSSSVPPSSLYSIRGESPVIYSSHPGALPNNTYGPVPPSNHPIAYNDPFTVRPRTSNTFHPVPYSGHLPRASMNEAQLRFMMSSGISPRPLPAQAQIHPGMRQQPFPHPAPHSFGPTAPPYPPTRMQAMQAPLRVLPPNLLPHHQLGEPGPLSAPPISPTFSNFMVRANPANNAHLLSILNTPSMARAAPTVS